MVLYLYQSCRIIRPLLSFTCSYHTTSKREITFTQQSQSFVNKSLTPKNLPLPQPVKGSTRWDRTANQFRQMHAYEAVIHNIKDCSETVRSITLKIFEPGLTFSAGQWVDFFIPNVETVAGFSMTSPPYLAEEQGILDLDIKYSKYPPTHWVHHTCKLGDKVTIRVGGEFFYEPKAGCKSANADLLLIGGGVGINPMASIAQHYVHILQLAAKGLTPGIKPGRLKLLYSAKNFKELVRRDLFEDLAKNVPTMSCSFFASKEDKATKVPLNVYKARISKKDLKDALKAFSNTNVFCFICGPIAMIETMEKLLLELGVEKGNIKYEKWE